MVPYLDMSQSHMADKRIRTCQPTGSVAKLCLIADLCKGARVDSCYTSVAAIGDLGCGNVISICQIARGVYNQNYEKNA